MTSGNKKLKNTGGKLDLDIISSAKKSALDAFNSAQKSLKNHISYEKPQPINKVFPSNHEIIGVLHDIKEQGVVKKNEIEVFVFNTNDKTLEYSTKTRSFIYRFKELGMNYKLVEKLMCSEGFRQTRFLREDIKSKSNEAVRKKVGEINEKIRSEFKLSKSFSLITSDPGSSAGYRINPDIKIQVIN